MRSAHRSKVILEAFDGVAHRSKVISEAFDGVTHRSKVILEAFDGVTHRSKIILEAFDGVTHRSKVISEAFDGVAHRSKAKSKIKELSCAALLLRSFLRFAAGLNTRVNSLYLGALVTVHRTPFIKYQLDS